MRPRVVVVQPKRFDGLLGIVEDDKPAFVQAFVPQATIEALDKAVLHRLSRLDELQCERRAGAPTDRGLHREILARCHTQSRRDTR